MFYKFIYPKNVTKPKIDMNIFSFSYTRLTEKPSYLHLHPYTEVVIPKNNCGLLVCAGEEYKMNPNSFYIIPPNTMHTERNISDSRPAEYFVVKVYDDINIGEDEIPPYIIEKPREMEMLKNYLIYAYESLTSEGEENDFAIMNLDCFYYTFKKMITSLNYSVTTLPVSTFSDLTKNIEYYITKNFRQDIKIADLAPKFGVSHGTMTKYFKRDLGCTPKEYLLEKRLSHSEYLLSTSNLTISQISEFSGFDSPAYFTYMFKAKNKVTPNEYRKTHSGKV